MNGRQLSEVVDLTVDLSPFFCSDISTLQLEAADLALTIPCNYIFSLLIESTLRAQDSVALLNEELHEGSGEAELLAASQPAFDEPVLHHIPPSSE